MSEEKPILPLPLPGAKIFLEGKDGIKPLQHKAEALTQFAAGLEEVPLASKAAETVAQLGEVMKKPHWAQAHNAAHDALTRARTLVAEGNELASHAYFVESIFNSRAPNAHTIKGVRHPVLEEALTPLTTYLEEFGEFITSWAGLSPSRMKAKEMDNALTPAQYRTNMHEALDTLKSANPDATIPKCGDRSCTIDHSIGSHTPMPATPTSNGHYHADGSYHPTGGTCAHEPHLPKGKSNTGWWVAGIVAAVGVGGYLIHEYGKAKKKEVTPKPGGWKDHVEQSKTLQARTL